MASRAIYTLKSINQLLWRNKISFICKDIERGTKRTKIKLHCKVNTNHQFTEIETSKLKNLSSIICKECDIEKKRDEAKSILATRGLEMTLSGRNMYETKRSRVECTDKNGFKRFSSISDSDDVVNSVFHERNPCSMENFHYLARLFGFTLISRDYKGYDEYYNVVDSQGYRYKACFKELKRRALEINPEFHIHNDYIKKHSNYIFESQRFSEGSEHYQHNIQLALAKNNYLFVSNSKGQSSFYIQCNDGFKYSSFNIYDICKGSKPNPFSKTNIYRIYNAQKLCNDNKLPFTVPEDQEFESAQYFYAKNIDGDWVKIIVDNVKRGNKNYQTIFPGFKHSIENINRKVTRERPNYRLLSTTYVNAKEKLEWELLDITNLPCEVDPTFHCDWSNFSNKNNPKGHPELARTRPNRALSILLKKGRFNFKPEEKFEKCRHINPLPFDQAVYEDSQDLNDFTRKPIVLIEYQGRHHREAIYGEETFEKIKKTDQIKKEYTESEKIPLLTLDETPIEELPKELSKKLKDVLPSTHLEKIEQIERYSGKKLKAQVDS